MKTLFILALVLVSVTVFAEGKQEVATSIEFLTTSAANMETWERGIDAFLAENPGVEVIPKFIDQTDGSTMTMDALVAAGTAPNVYADFMGRVSKYITPDFALDLVPYMTDLDDYMPGVLGPFYRGDKLLGLPRPGSAQGMGLNVTMLNEMGLAVVEEMSISQFLAAAAKTKAFYNGEKWATGAFAANQSGDYLMFQWFASFGANKFNPGEYEVTVINTPAGVKTMEFLKMLMDKGYIRKESAILTDDDYAPDYAQGKYLATAWFAGWDRHYFPTAIEQGFITEAHERQYVRFPAAPGVDRVPACTSFPGFVAYNSDDAEKNRLAASLISHLNSTDMQEYLIPQDMGNANRKSVVVNIDDPYWNQIDAIVKANGTMDLGMTTQQYSEMRTKMFPRFQDMWNGKQTPADALAQYEKEVNEVLAR